MSPNGHHDHRLDSLGQLPRPVYGQADSLPNIALGYRHQHPWGQLSHARSGLLRVRTREGLYLVPPQHAVWIAARVPHQVSCDAGTHIRSLYIQPDALPWPAAQCRVIAVEALLGELIQTFAGLPVEYDSTGADGRLVQVLLDRLACAREAPLLLPLPRDRQLRQICNRLQRAADDPRSLGDWAQRLGVSQKTLSRRFLRETGLTFRHWRQRARLLTALPALERGERVTDVALACGYASLSAFIAAFGEHFGQSPGEFLRRRPH
ncbi:MULTISPECIES: helix-turn-helix transcriptional regulator [unclassified Pseudomonas]|uniref:AraC family transcriptional regulator n=1 Tax=unclassified Pseudomonas TaxID=196821 RepID=UPI002446DC69|nr:MULTISPECIES: helix-turn-helix transcriptional regulator [unclassified Pseudomonas]MDH0300870.1 helix-turn-helix transcriptional regulator [Pseudomonas sp. GD04091]MDH1985221.1 helix-turn-helix transcriptional regulator [Pseudomonas sp. GD03689]